MRPRIEVVAFVLTGDRKRGIALCKVDGEFVQYLAVERDLDGQLWVAPLRSAEDGNPTYECFKHEGWLPLADLAPETRARIENLVVERAEGVR